MITLRASISAQSLLVLAVFWHAPAQAQMTRINVGYSAISGDALPAWVAKDAGISASLFYRWNHCGNGAGIGRHADRSIGRAGRR